MNNKEEINQLVNYTIENNFLIDDIAKLVYIVFKDNEKINKNISKIRIEISETIFMLYINKLCECYNEGNNYNEESEEWKKNRKRYVKIYDMSLKLKDAKFKDKIMKSYMKIINV